MFCHCYADILKFNTTAFSQKYWSIFHVCITALSRYFHYGVYLLRSKMQNRLLFQQKTESESKIPLFRFLLNPVLDQKWIRAIPRENLNVSNSCRICAKHFTESDIQTMTSSSRKIRESGDELVELIRV